MPWLGEVGRVVLVGVIEEGLKGVFRSIAVMFDHITYIELISATSTHQSTYKIGGYKLGVVVYQHVLFIVDTDFGLSPVSYHYGVLKIIHIN